MELATTLADASSCEKHATYEVLLLKSKNNKIDKSTISGDQNTLRVFEQELDAILSFKEVMNRIANDLSQFEENLSESLKHNEFLDLKLIRELYVTSAALLRICQKVPYAEHVPFSLAAISYFVKPNDGNDDINSIDGFEDDKQVLVMVIRQFKLEDQIESEIKEMQKNGEIKSA